MAGDWIKMRQDLGDDPAVVLISARVDIEEDTVVGKLHRLWCWADKHTTDGTAPAITGKWVDRYVSQPGFAEAMKEAGWIEFNESGVVFPSFERHNGQSAKTRAEATTRQRLSRANRDEGVTGVGRTSIPRPFVRHVMQRDGHRCVYCGRESTEAREATRKSILSIDHIIPETRGGSAAVENLACCCKQCNNEKNDRTPEEWGLLPTFLQHGVTYEDGKLSHKTRDCDVTKTLPEKRREEKSNTPSLRSGVARASKKCPDSFVVTDELQKWADSEYPNVDVKTATDKFRDHTFSTARVDWPGTWRNWIRKDSEFNAAKPAHRSESFRQQDKQAAEQRWAAFTGNSAHDRDVIDITHETLELEDGTFTKSN